MSDIVQVLTRKDAILQRLDPTGRKWIVNPIKGKSLYFASPDPYRPDFVSPREFKGTWTSKHVLDEQITLYLNRVWDESDLATKVAERSKLAKEEQKRARASKETTSTGERGDRSAASSSAERTDGGINGTGLNPVSTRNKTNSKDKRVATQSAGRSKGKNGSRRKSGNVSKSLQATKEQSTDKE